MHKVIHSDFQIDLSSHNITTTEENHWFSDRFFTKYSFPFEIDITKDLVDFFEYLQNFNSMERETILLVTYVNGDKMEEAFLDIEEVNDSISAVLRYGIEEFPNFNKKLAELPLQSLSIADIYEHAKTVITQTFPAVNYNFPQIHTDKIDTSETIWEHFGEIINNYQDNEFLVNEVVDDVTYNRNIMQAAPYLLHVLKIGFLDKGFELKGDILTDDIIKKKCLFTEKKNYNLTDEITVNLSVNGDDYTSQSGNGAYYNMSVDITEKGRYRIVGIIQLYSRWRKIVFARLKYRNTILWQKVKYVSNHHSGYLHFYEIDITFDTINDALPDTLTFESSQFYRSTNLLCDVTATSEILFDSAGVGIPNVTNKNEVDLTKVVPDMTFGNLVKVVKNWYNLDLEQKGKEIWMNYIEKSINYSNAFDLQKFEVKNPQRKFNKGLSFLLKFESINHEDYELTQIFYDFEGVSTDSFVRNNKTKDIQINATPLPLLFRNGVQTAHSFSDDTSKLFVVLYNGLTDSLNICKDPSEMLLPNIYENYFQKWLKFRVDAITVKWDFKAWEEELRGLTKKCYGYKNYHIIKSIQKKEIRKDLFLVEIETDTLG